MPREIIPVKNYMERLYRDYPFMNYKEEAIDKAWEIAIHAFGIFPEVAIRSRRPNEAEAAHEYRCQIYQPITKKYIGKVMTELNKIRRSSDWAIIFDNEAVPAKLKNSKQDISLEQYLTYGLPVFTSLTNWLFSLALPAYLIDANAFIVVMPYGVENIASNDLVKPMPEIIPSGMIKYYLPDEVLMYLSEEKCEFWVYPEDADPYLMPGDILYVVTKNSFSRYEQASEDYRLREVFNYAHDLGYLPITQAGGIVQGKKDGRILYKSRISDMIPDLNEAVREYSDVQAEAVNNIYSERWEYSQNECTTCAGTGEVNQDYGGCSPCKKCNGTGHIARSPYSKIIIKQEMTGEINNMPIPPAGYIEKSTEIIKIQDERVKQHIADALSAINMGFLEDVPLNESGKAKEVDRDALNTFVHSIAEDLVRIADDVVKIINDIRYKLLVPDDAARAAMVPVIPVPENFDLLNADYLLKELSAAQASNVSPVIINALQKEYAAKKFNANPDIRQELELTLTLDPLSGITDDDKLTRLSAKGISQESYIISSNITEFIARAIYEYKDAFFNFDLQRQKEILRGYAAEVRASQVNTLVPPIEA